MAANPTIVPPRSLEKALAYLRRGGEIIIPTAYRTTVLDGKTLKRFEAAGTYLLKEDGEGYRMRSGKGSVYLLPGQLRYFGPPPSALTPKRPPANPFKRRRKM